MYYPLANESSEMVSCKKRKHSIMSLPHLRSRNCITSCMYMYKSVLNQNQTKKYWGDSLKHGLINYIDTKAKCCHLKKLTCKGTLRQVFLRVYMDWRYSQSCWYFLPSFANCAPLTFSLVQLSPSPLPCVNRYNVYTYTVLYSV